MTALSVVGKDVRMPSKVDKRQQTARAHINKSRPNTQCRVAIKTNSYVILQKLIRAIKLVKVQIFTTVTAVVLLNFKRTKRF